MKRYVSDLHLNHKNVLCYDNRRFTDIEIHDEAIIRNINQMVSITDQLYILWDISWKLDSRIKELLKTIKCQNIYFLEWNHDFSSSIKFYKKLWWINLWLMYIDKDAKVVLSHYPIEERYHSRHKDWEWYIHLHWHSHWNSIMRDNRIDVSFYMANLLLPICLNQR